MDLLIICTLHSILSLTNKRFRYVLIRILQSESFYRIRKIYESYFITFSCGSAVEDSGDDQEKQEHLHLETLKV